LRSKLDGKDISRDQYFLNKIQSLKVEWSKDKGRGVFAKTDIPKGALMIVDKSIASVSLEEGDAKKGFYWQQNRTVHDSGMKQHVDACKEICQLKGINALRLGYIYGGLSDKIPPLEIFLKNNY